jgi:hypothetical protein
VPEAWIDSLFGRMSGMYGSKFADLWRGTDLASVRKLWGTELSSLSREQLRGGVESLRRRPFPPTLPEFVMLCQPAVSVDAAIYEAVEQLRNREFDKDVWSNPAIYWAAIKVGVFDMLNLAHGALIKRFAAALESVLAQDQIPAVPPRLTALPATGSAQAQPERVKEEMTKIRAMQKQVGNKDWAKRIIARREAGQKIAYMTLKMAKQALGIQDAAA